jgi:hypothetical protein
VALKAAQSATRATQVSVNIGSTIQAKQAPDRRQQHALPQS